MEKEILTIEIPEEIKTIVQKCDIECSSRRDIIIYLMEHNINVSLDRFNQYQKEYDEKYYSFEIAKKEVEKNYIIPLIGNKKCNWSLDYETNIITVFFN